MRSHCLYCGCERSPQGPRNEIFFSAPPLLGLSFTLDLLIYHWCPPVHSIFSHVANWYHTEFFFRKVHQSVLLAVLYIESPCLQLDRQWVLVQSSSTESYFLVFLFISWWNQNSRLITYQVTPLPRKWFHWLSKSPRAAFTFLSGKYQKKQFAVDLKYTETCVSNWG